MVCLTLRVMHLCLGEPYVGDVHPATGGMMRFEIYGRHARDAVEGERWRFGTKEYCAVVTLDVRNAFNSANWGRIVRTFFNMDTPPYLMEILNNTFRTGR